MLRIHPFRAVRPASAFAARIASVPYDVVSTAEARDLAADNPYCFLHVVRSEIDLPEQTDPYDDAVYHKARKNFDALIEQGALVRDEEPRLFLYRQVWKEHTQVGLVCCCHLEDYERDVIRKHEKTRKVKEDDRTRHVLSVNANTGPVFQTYRDRSEIDRRVKKEIAAPPLYDFVAVDGVRHTVWAVADPIPFVDAFRSVNIAYVADGHHRAASAWRAGKERAAANPDHRGDEEYNRYLAVLFPSSQLKILPYNRVIRDLNGLDTVQFLVRLGEVGRLEATEKPSPDGAGSFGVYLDGTWHRLTLDPATIDAADPIGSLDVALLHDRILGPILNVGDPRTDDRIDFIGGIRGTDHLKHLVDCGEYAVAFAMHPTTIEQLMAVADARLVMPPKSTWFEPKLRSGLLIHTLD